jgi:hypothetical protein
VLIDGGASNAKQAAGSVNIQGGENTQRLNGGPGGDVNIGAGASPMSAGGSLAFRSGGSEVTSGNVLLTSTDSKASGDVRLLTGSGLDSSGDLLVETGNSSAGQSGNLSLRAGFSRAGTAGSVSIAGGLGDQTFGAGGSVSILGGKFPLPFVIQQINFGSHLLSYFGIVHI